MSKEDLIKRQMEVEEEFNKTQDLKNQHVTEANKMITRMNELTGAWSELDRQIKALETPDPKAE